MKYFYLFFILLFFFFKDFSFSQKNVKSQKSKYSIKQVIDINSKIITAAFAKDRELLAIGDFDGNIKIFNTKNKNEVLSIKAHDGWTNALAFSPNRNFIISAGSDFFLNLWDCRDGKNIYRAGGFKKIINRIEFLDENFFVILTNNLQLFKINEKNSLKSFTDSSKYISFFTLNPKSKQLICGNSDGDVIILDYEFNIIKRFNSHKGEVSAIAVSETGEYFATAGLDGIIKIYGLNNYSTIGKLEIHKEQINSIDFSSNDKYLISAGWDKDLVIWNLKKLDVDEIIKDEIDVITSCFFLKNEIITTSFDKKLKFRIKK